jgi:hypothetical protein
VEQPREPAPEANGAEELVLACGPRGRHRDRRGREQREGGEHHGEIGILEGRDSLGALGAGTPQLVDSLGQRPDAQLVHRRRVARQREPEEGPRMAARHKGPRDALEQHRDVVWPRGSRAHGAQQAGVEGVEGARHHGLDQPLAATKMMKDRGVRHADVRRDLLQTDPRGPGGHQVALRRVQDRRAGILGGAALARGRSRGLFARFSRHKGHERYQGSAGAANSIDNFVSDIYLHPCQQGATP